MERVTIINNERYLRQVSEPVVFPDERLAYQIGMLKEYCLQNRVYAMAGVQLGIPKRVIYIKSTVENKTDQSVREDEGKIFINPEIISAKGETYFWEACQSCVDEEDRFFTGLVKRPYRIWVKYQDMAGKKHLREMKGFETTVFCHEYDHLNGILHMDRTDNTILTTLEERVALRNKEKYRVVNEDSVWTEKISNTQNVNYLR